MATHGRRHGQIVIAIAATLLVSGPLATATPPSSPGNAAPPPDTRCDEVTCRMLRLDDDLNANNVLDTTPRAGQADALYWGSQTVWTGGSDGPASGMDADLLDGVDSLQFLRSDVSGTLAGDLVIRGNLGVGTTDPFALIAGGFPHQTGNHLSATGDHWLVNTSPDSDPYLYIQSGDPWGPTPSAEARGYVGIKGPQHGQGFCPNDPAGYLCIRADSRAISLTADGGGQRHLTVAPSGNVGIGTTAPTEKLMIVGGSLHVLTNWPLTGRPTDDGIYSNTYGASTWGDYGFDDGPVNHVANNIRFITNSKQGLSDGQFPVRMKISENGNVGIGTLNPQSSLEVGGYVQLARTSGAPPAADCDGTTERGRMKVDSTAGLLYVCMDSGWVGK